MSKMGDLCIELAQLRIEGYSDKEIGKITGLGDYEGFDELLHNESVENTIKVLKEEA